MFDVVVARAVVADAGERRGLNPPLPDEVAQPEHPLAGGVTIVARTGHRSESGRTAWPAIVMAS